MYVCMITREIFLDLDKLFDIKKVFSFKKILINIRSYVEPFLQYEHNIYDPIYPTLFIGLMLDLQIDIDFSTHSKTAGNVGSVISP